MRWSSFSSTVAGVRVGPPARDGTYTATNFQEILLWQVTVALDTAGKRRLLDQRTQTVPLSGLFSPMDEPDRKLSLALDVNHPA